jgi:glycerol kinase
MCFNKGEVKNTYGTGCFMLMNTGEKAITSTNNLLTTVAWRINNKTHYALEGSVFIAGAVVQWLRDELKIIENSSDVERLASQVDDNGGVTFVPAFTGLGAPYWNQDARGSIFGLTRGSNRSHIARAALESIAFQTYDVLTSMKRDSGLEIPILKVDGGVTKNRLLMQFQSDLLATKIDIPENTETTAMGAAYLAGLAVGYWNNIEEIISGIKISSSFTAQMSNENRITLLTQWDKAIKASIYLSKI